MFVAALRGICGAVDPSYRKRAEHSIAYDYRAFPVAASHHQKSSLPTMPTPTSPVAYGAFGAAFACELDNCSAYGSAYCPADRTRATGIVVSFIPTVIPTLNPTAIPTATAGAARGL
jgi:hypothetical protein